VRKTTRIVQVVEQYTSGFKIVEWKEEVEDVTDEPYNQTPSSDYSHQQAVFPVEGDFVQKLKKHWIYLTVSIVVFTAGITWTTSDYLYIQPRDYEIRKLSDEIRRLSDEIGRREKLEQPSSDQGTRENGESEKPLR